LEEKRMPSVVDQWKFGSGAAQVWGSMTNGIEATKRGLYPKEGSVTQLASQKGFNNGPLKLLTVGTKRGSGRNNTGRITAFHRGGGSKQSYRHLDSFREYQLVVEQSPSEEEFKGKKAVGVAKPPKRGLCPKKGSVLRELKRSTERFGRIVRLEYDPNRSGCIALVEWYSSYDDLYWYGGQSSAVGGWLLQKTGKSDKKESSLKNHLSPAFSDEMLGNILRTPSSVSYILAMEGMVVGGWLYSKAKGSVDIHKVPSLDSVAPVVAKPPKEVAQPPNGGLCPKEGGSAAIEEGQSPLLLSSPSSSEVVEGSSIIASKSDKKTFMDVDVLGGGVAGWRGSVSRDFWSKPGVRLPLSEMVLGSTVCNVDGRYLRAAGSSGQVLGKEEATATKGACVVVRFASGVRQRFLGSCLASVGSVSKRSSLCSTSSAVTPGKGSQAQLRKARLGLAKAGASRWLGRRPIVRGVAMNPVDHPHGGGEGRTSGGRCSVTPWGKLTKGQPTRKKSKPALQKDQARKGGRKGK
jgi:ribosomal protein L2